MSEVQDPQGELPNQEPINDPKGSSLGSREVKGCAALILATGLVGGAIYGGNRLYQAYQESQRIDFETIAAKHADDIQAVVQSRFEDTGKYTLSLPTSNNARVVISRYSRPFAEGEGKSKGSMNSLGYYVSYEDGAMLFSCYRDIETEEGGFDMIFYKQDPFSSKNIHDPCDDIPCPTYKDYVGYDEERLPNERMNLGYVIITGEITPKGVVNVSYIPVTASHNTVNDVFHWNRPPGNYTQDDYDYNRTIDPDRLHILALPLLDSDMGSSTIKVSDSAVTPVLPQIKNTPLQPNSDISSAIRILCDDYLKLDDVRRKMEQKERKDPMEL